MTRPKSTTKLNTSDFFKTLAYNCPDCHSRVRLDMPGSFRVEKNDVVLDKCPDCGILVVIDLGTNPLIAEGYDFGNDATERVLEMKKSGRILMQARASEGGG